MNEYNFTGNPFVDTGLSVLVAKAREAGWMGKTVQELTPDVLRQAIGDGKWLAQANRRLKAFSMVVGNNSPLTNTSSNPSLRKANRGRLNPGDDDGFKAYVSILQGFVAEATAPPENDGVPCECCGMRPSTMVLSANGKEIGRDWFPLAGSLGSDAQALPTSSRAPRICSLCLLGIQALPLGVTLLHGKLACFQSTSWEMTQLLTEETYRETQAMLASTAGTEKVAALGAKGGTTSTALRLLRLFDNLQVNRRMLELPSHVTINVWLFSNSGTGADCDLIEIPNNALVFLWEAARRYRVEVEGMLRRESKKPDYQLLECIHRQRDYAPLYPAKGTTQASKGLFEFYQMQVLGQPLQALRVAEKVACLLRQRLQRQAEQEQRASAPKGGKGKPRQTRSEKFLQQLTERHPFRDLELAERNAVRRLFADFAEEGLLTLEEYVLLFPCETFQPLRTQWRGWLWIWFYLNHENLSADVEPPQWEEVAMFTNSRVKQFALDVFDDYRERRGLARVKRDILDHFRRGEISTANLQRWFCNLAERKEGYTNEDWDDLCRDENGNNVTNEVRFQFRLELANLYRQAVVEQQSR
jgi:CRISPR-associated protein Cst1